MSTFDKTAVKDAARGRWAEIFGVFAPGLEKAMEHPGRHVPCPVHGGTDGFRLFPDFEERGNGICNTCGARTDGFAMLCWINGWSFRQALDAVGNYLMVTPAAGTAVRAEADEQTYCGTVVWSGMTSYGRSGRKSFQLRLRCEDGTVQRLWGVDLKRAAETAGLVPGDRARLIRMGKAPVRTRDGRTFEKSLWNAQRLESEAEAKARIEREEAREAELLAKSAQRQSQVAAFWEKAEAIDMTNAEPNPAEAYLQSRGLAGLDRAFTDGALRFAKVAWYRDAEGRMSVHPAMLAAVTDAEGRLVTLHRTYLTPEGAKADVAEVKKLMTVPYGLTISGAAVRLGEPEDVLCAAEGIETALSVALGTGYPCWSTVSAGGMKSLQVPSHVKTVFIFADKDRSDTGSVAAEELRARLCSEGRLAVIVSVADPIPDGRKGIDWNDVLKSKGTAGFPLRKPLCDTHKEPQ